MNEPSDLRKEGDDKMSHPQSCNCSKCKQHYRKMYEVGQSRPEPSTEQVGAKFDPNDEEIERNAIRIQEAIGLGLDDCREFSCWHLEEVAIVTAELETRLKQSGEHSALVAQRLMLERDTAIAETVEPLRKEAELAVSRGKVEALNYTLEEQENYKKFVAEALVIDGWRKERDTALAKLKVCREALERIKNSPGNDVAWPCLSIAEEAIFKLNEGK